MSKISSLFKNNRFLMIFSFILALIIWLGISIIYSPQSEKTITDIPIEISLSSTGGSRGMSSFGEDVKAKVTVSGKKYILEQLTSDSITVNAITDSVTKAGEYNLQLSAKKNSVLSDFEVLSVYPPSISVYLDTKKETELNLEIECVGAQVQTLDAKNENMLLEPEFVDPSSSIVTIVGPETEVKQIDSVKAVTEVNTLLTETRQYTSKIVMYDINNNVLYDSTSSSNILKYTTPSFTSAEIMANVRMRKTVPLKLDVKNAPDSLPELTIHEITGSDLSTEQVVDSVGIKGAKEVISQIENITLDGVIDFSAIKYDNPDSFNFKLTLPNISGVIYDEYTKVSNVYFEINIDKTHYSTKSFDIPIDIISVTDIPEGKNISVQTTLKGVNVIGPSDSVRKLSVNDIKVSISAADLIENGASTVSPTITVISSDCWISGTYEITAEVS